MVLSVFGTGTPLGKEYQASVVVRLGTLYQEGLHGVISIWHWNSIANQYEWSLKFTGKDIS